MDPVAETDQRKEHAKRTAQIIAAFYKELISQGVTYEAAEALARNYLLEGMADDA